MACFTEQVYIIILQLATLCQLNSTCLLIYSRINLETNLESQLFFMTCRVFGRKGKQACFPYLRNSKYEDETECYYNNMTHDNDNDEVL